MTVQAGSARNPTTLEMLRQEGCGWEPSWSSLVAQRCSISKLKTFQTKFGAAAQCKRVVFSTPLLPDLTAALLSSRGTVMTEGTQATSREGRSLPGSFMSTGVLAAVPPGESSPSSSGRLEGSVHPWGSLQGFLMRPGAWVWLAGRFL